MASIFVTGLGFGNIFPLIFSILIERFPEKSNELSGLMVMAISGGAVMPLVMGAVADISVTASFMVPLASLAVVAANAVASLRRS
jgi:MFS transporter, FHS family, L-fucose permease